MAVTILPYLNDYATDPEVFEQQGKFVGITENPSDGVQNIPIVYGRRRVEGIRLWVYAVPSNNSLLYATYALSEGQCRGIARIYIDDIPVFIDSTQVVHRTPVVINTGTYSGVFEFELVDGRAPTATGAGPSAMLLRDLNINKNYQNLCYLVCKFTYSNPSPYRRIPKISVDLDGRLVNTYLFNSIQAPSYRTNPAWIVADLLTNTNYGGGVNQNLIDRASFSQVSVQCDKVNNLGIKPYDANWICDTSQPLLQNIRSFLDFYNMGLNLIGDRYVLSIESAPTDGGITFNESNIVGTISIQLPDLSNRYNKVVVDHPDKIINYQFRSQTFSIPTTDDNGVLLEQRISANPITDYIAANHYAQMVLRRSRGQRIYRFTATKIAHQLRPGDYVTLNLLYPQITNRRVVIIGMTMNDDYTFEMECIDWEAGFYADNFTNLVSPPPLVTQNPPGTGTTPIPPAEEPPPPDSTYRVNTSGVNNGTVNEGATFSWVVNTTNVPDGTVINWRLFASSGTIGATDVTPSATSGTLTIINNLATYSITVAADALTEGSETWGFEIKSGNGTVLGVNFVTIQDTSITPPPPTFQWSFAGAPFLDVVSATGTRVNNTNWYIGFTNATGTAFDLTETDTTGTIGSWGTLVPTNPTTYANDCVRTRIVRRTSTAGTPYCVVELDVCIIDRLFVNQTITKSIYCVYDDFLRYQQGTVPFVKTYQRTYNSQILQFDYENPPTGVNTLKSRLVSSSSGSTVIEGYEFIYNSTLGTFATPPGCVRLEPVAGKTGHYATGTGSTPTRNTITIPINIGSNLTNLNSAAGLNGSTYQAPFSLTDPNTTNPRLLRLHFFEHNLQTNAIIPIGFKVVRISLDRLGLTNKYYDAGRANLSTTIGSITNPMPI